MSQLQYRNENENFISNFVFQFIKQEDAMRCNNRDNLLQLSFSFQISIFSEAYSYITQSDIYDGAFVAKIVSP